VEYIICIVNPALNTVYTFYISFYLTSCKSFVSHMLISHSEYNISCFCC